MATQKRPELPPSTSSSKAKTVNSLILTLRGQSVIISSDLADLYGVTAKRLNEQVKRNRERFPDDFVFELTQEEKEQVVANCDHLEKLKFSPNLPYAFTEHGAIMAANVLNSAKAVEMSVAVVRAFIEMRELIATQAPKGKQILPLLRDIPVKRKELQSIMDVLIKNTGDIGKMEKEIKKMGEHIDDLWRLLTINLSLTKEEAEKRLKK